MSTHRFHYESDHTKGGTWFTERGLRICDWSWDEQRKMLKIRHGPRGVREISLSGIDLEKLEPADLGARLSEVALQAAQRSSSER